jgi:hypothetical protein
MSAHNDPRREAVNVAEPRYYYRRRLGARELLPAVGAAVGAGLAAFYLAKIFLERTPLVESNDGDSPQLTRHRSLKPVSPARHTGRR